VGTIRQYSVAVISALHEFVLQEGYSKLSQLKGLCLVAKCINNISIIFIIMEHTLNVSHTGIVKNQQTASIK